MCVKPTVVAGGLVGLALCASLSWSTRPRPLERPALHLERRVVSVQNKSDARNNFAATTPVAAISGGARALHALTRTVDARERWQWQRELLASIAMWSDDTFAHFWITADGRALLERGDVDTAGIILGEWARRDADAALAWTLGCDDTLSGPFTLAVVRGMSSEQLTNQPLRWTAWSASLREEVTQAVVARQVETLGFERGRAWIEAVLPVEHRSLAHHTYGILLAERDPVEAARWIDDDATLASDATRAAIASAWAQHDPVSALRWALDTGAADDDGGVPMQVMRVVAERDTATATAILTAMNGDDYWDLTREALALAQHDERPELARQWAELVVEPTRRAQLLARLTL
jgi:hypothetical protein